MRLPPRTRVTTLYTGLNQMIQSTKPSSATSSPSAQGGTRRILEDTIRARGVACVIFVVRSPTPRLLRGSLVELRAVRAEAGGCSRPCVATEVPRLTLAPPPPARRPQRRG
jgi:hypothetical protein